LPVAIGRSAGAFEYVLVFVVLFDMLDIESLSLIEVLVCGLETDVATPTGAAIEFRKCGLILASPGRSVASLLKKDLLFASAHKPDVGPRLNRSGATPGAQEVGLSLLLVAGKSGSGRGGLLAGNDGSCEMSCLRNL
jgi:hypothetical protein